MNNLNYVVFHHANIATIFIKILALIALMGLIYLMGLANKIVRMDIKKMMNKTLVKSPVIVF